MDAHPAVHPTGQTLSSYGLGKLDGATAEAVNKHLEWCSDCRMRAAEVSSDSFLDRVRNAQRGSGKSASGQSQHGETESYKGAEFPAPHRDDTLPPGLADHREYEIKKELGRGGMGVVYLAHNTLMGRDEVLKVMGRHIMEHPGVLDRFLREIRAVAKLRHPNIVTAYHATRVGDSIVFAMEYVECLDLSKMVKAKGPLPIGHACNFAYQAALGLQHAHEAGLVHRDIKPHNLMLSRSGDRPVVKVLDFGLAKVTCVEKVEGALTSQGQALGTPDYMAPEQILDAPSADIRADIYSLGGTLYYLLAGRPPFQADSLYDMYQAHISQNADPLNLVGPEVPAELAALVAKMMAKAPARRFQTPGEVARALTPFFKQRGAGLESAKPEISLAPQSRARGETGGAAQVPRSAATRALQSPPPMAEKSTVASRPESRWASLIGGQETERSGDQVAAAVRTRRPPWVWPAVAAAFLMGFIALGIVITIRTKHGETKVVASDDKPFQADVDGIHIERKPSRTQPNGSTLSRSPADPASGLEAAEPPRKRDDPHESGFVSLFNGRNLDG